MTKHRFQLWERTPLAALLVLAALGGVGGWLLQLRAGQHPAVSALQNVRKLQETLQKKDNPPPPRSAPAPAERPPEAGPKDLAAGEADAEAAHLTEYGAGKRDPFKLPPVPGSGAVKVTEGVVEAAGPMPAGNRGLVISQVKLEGVVRQDVSNKMLAVVTNETKRAYFLTENEAVYNGVVSKITPDAVYFTENVLDREGKVTTREVIKRLNSAPGEER